jgi:hypothetical protein
MEKIDDSYDKSADFYIAMVLFPTFLLAILFLPFSLGEIAIFTHINWLVAILLGLIPTAHCIYIVITWDYKEILMEIVIILSYIDPIIARYYQRFNHLHLEVDYNIIGGMIILIANIIVVFSKKIVIKITIFN